MAGENCDEDVATSSYDDDAAELMLNSDCRLPVMFWCEAAFFKSLGELIRVAVLCEELTEDVDGFG